MLTYRNLFKYSLLFICIACLTGCLGFFGEDEVPLHREMSPMVSSPLCRIAVLPFLNDSDFPQGGDLVSKVMATQLRDTVSYRIVQEGDILRAYQQLHIFPGEPPTLDQLRIIGDRSKAQLLVTGVILAMREDIGENRVTDPVLILEIALRDGQTGETLWTTFHRRRGTDYQKAMHIGTIHTATGLAKQMVNEIINSWYEKGLPQCI